MVRTLPGAHRLMGLTGSCGHPPRGKGYPYAEADQGGYHAIGRSISKRAEAFPSSKPKPPKRITAEVFARPW